MFFSPSFEVLNHIAPGAARQTVLLGPLTPATTESAGSGRVWSERWDAKPDPLPPDLPAKALEWTPPSGGKRCPFCLLDEVSSPDFFKKRPLSAGN